jgi:hypothetical protein
MNKQETAQIITLIAGNYQTVADKTREQKQMMINTWHECLNDLQYNVVLSATKKCIIESPYPPTIHDVRKNATEIMNPSDNRTPIEAWQEAYQMICSGTYMTQNEFNAHSDEVKRFFGSVENLRSYSTNEDFNIDVVRSNFISQYDRICKTTQEIKMIPPKLLELHNCIKSIDDK